MDNLSFVVIVWWSNWFVWRGVSSKHVATFLMKGQIGQDNLRPSTFYFADHMIADVHTKAQVKTKEIISTHNNKTIPLVNIW